MNLLSLYATVGRTSAGRRLFSAMVCRRAPYFASISPVVEELKSGFCRVSLRKRRKVQNHIGTVHVIAAVNACELAMGVLMEATTPKHLRWIPKAMTTRYLKKAATDLSATAEFDPAGFPSEPGDIVVPCRVTDRNGEVVVEADITVYVTPKPSRAG